MVRNNDRHQIRTFRQVGDGRVGFHALDLVVVGVHRIDADTVLRFECGGEEPPAVLQSRRRPDNGDGPRVEHLVDRLHLRRCPDLHASPPEPTALISASPPRRPRSRPDRDVVTLLGGEEHGRARDVMWATSSRTTCAQSGGRAATSSGRATCPLSYFPRADQDQRAVEEVQLRPASTPPEDRTAPCPCPPARRFPGFRARPTYGSRCAACRPGCTGTR